MGILDFLSKKPERTPPRPRKKSFLKTGLFELFGKKPVSSDQVYSLRTEIHPLRLPAHRNEAADLEIELANVADVDLLTSVVVSVTKPLGLDQTGLSQEREVRLGVLRPLERRRLTVQIWSSQRTAPGTYPVRVYVISHYRDYGHVLNEVRQLLEVRVA